MIRYKWKALWVLLPLVIGIISPVAILFCVLIQMEEYTYNQAFLETFDGMLSEAGDVLFAIYGLLPFIALTTYLFFNIISKTTKSLFFLSFCGLVGILSIMIPAHISVWQDLYGPNGASSTASLIFIFIPLYCLAALTITLFSGWFFLWITKKTCCTKKRK